jgi:hypothetical protein
MQFNLNSPNIKPDEKFKGVLDPKKKMIACVLLQPLYGGQAGLCNFFDVRLWATSPSDDFRIMQGTLSEWQQLADKWNKNATT